jgi:hypothetical protein
LIALARAHEKISRFTIRAPGYQAATVDANVGEDGDACCPGPKHDVDLTVRLKKQ